MDEETIKRHNTQELLNKRNTATAEQKFREYDEKIQQQQIRIDGLVSTLTTMSDRMNQLELRLNLQKIQQLGTGPSVRD